jgi:quercetin dioxygenase-like cupin family protein
MTAKIIRSSEGHILMGGRQTIKLTAEDTDQKIAMVYSITPAGSGIPVHIHSQEDEIFNITKGALEVNLDGTMSILNEGDMIFMPKEVPHGFKALEDTEMWVTLAPGGGEKMFIDLAALPPGPPDMGIVAKICESYGLKFV